MVNLLTGHDVRPEGVAAGLAAVGRFPANRLGPSWARRTGHETFR